MNGVLVIDKPAGITSHDVVAAVRRRLGTRRVGHTGTLDPFATGVMVVLVGQATRLAPFLDKDEKEYDALVRFGFETDTGDSTGVPRNESSQTVVIRAADVEAVLRLFRGEIEQIPPMYSAKKIAGKKLYELARRGETVERPPSRITIKRLEITNSTEPSAGTWDVGLRIVCSAGTYIRVLAEDIGRAAGGRAHLAELRRTRSGRFDLDQSVSLDAFDELDDPAGVMLPIEAAVSHLPVFNLPAERVPATRNGLSTTISDTTFVDGEAIRLASGDGELVAVGTYDAATSELKPRVVLV